MTMKCINGFPTCSECRRNMIYEIRPLPGLSEVRRYAEGKWIPDDGRWDLAFIGLDNYAPISMYFDPSYQKNIEWSYCKNMAWQENVSNHPHSNPWHYQLNKGAKEWGGDWGRERHPNKCAGDLGMNENCKIHSCSNGRIAEFQIYNPFIKQGLLREKESKRIVTFPDVIDCMYCGEIEISFRSAGSDRNNIAVQR